MVNVSEEQLIERVANYWNKRPCNIRHSEKPVGSAEYFDEVEKRKYFVEPHIPRFADFKSWDLPIQGVALPVLVLGHIFCWIVPIGLKLVGMLLDHLAGDG